MPKANSNTRATRNTRKPAAPAPAKPEQATAPVESNAGDLRSLSNAAKTVERCATNFNLVSGRDEAYRQFYGRVMRAQNGTATLAEIKAAGKPAPNKSDAKRTLCPDYNGSALSIDAGAINRAIKAGYFTASENGSRLTATDKAKADKYYLGKA